MAGELTPGRLPAARLLRSLPAWFVHAAAASVVLLVLLSAGQPLFTEDAWWYLSMGEAYLAQGPWLANDPLLHTAEGPPASAAWLFAVLVASVERFGGFHGLRVLHATLVATALGLAWGLLRKACDSRRLASFGTAGFAALSAYRLFQLRPQLVSILAALVLTWLLLEPRDGPSRMRIAAAALVCALWANLHAAFVLGPALIAAGGVAVAFDALWRERTLAPAAPRLRRLAAAFGLALLATVVNPAGIAPHRLYFEAGGATPDLAVVVDEWAPLGLFHWPVAGLPPSPLVWLLAWALLVSTAVLVVEALRSRSARGGDGAARAPAVDPAWLGASLVSLAALTLAVRFVWLGIFPLLALGQRARAGLPRPPTSRQAWSAAVAAVALALAFVRIGDWPAISRGVAPGLYARPYPATKYYAHAVWFLRDAGLEGNLYNDYSRGNFLGYWLGPRMRVFVNGSLNLPKAAMQAMHAIARRGGDGVTLEELLQRHEVDVFFGVGLPEWPRGGVVEPSTTGHLADTPGWLPVFRNVRSAVYVRDDERNRANLARVAAYYAREGVPFDRERGFDGLRVIRESPGWAFEHALVPVHHAALEDAARTLDPTRRAAARSQLAAIQLALGLYERSERLDRGLLASQQQPVTAARRLVWALLQQGRTAEALEIALRLEAIAAPGDALSRVLIDAARRCTALPDSESRALAASTPLFAPVEVQRLLTGYREPEARAAR